MSQQNKKTKLRKQDLTWSKLVAADTLFQSNNNNTGSWLHFCPHGPHCLLLSVKHFFLRFFLRRHIRSWNDKLMKSVFKDFGQTVTEKSNVIKGRYFIFWRLDELWIKSKAANQRKLHNSKIWTRTRAKDREQIHLTLTIFVKCSLPGHTKMLEKINNGCRDGTGSSCHTCPRGHDNLGYIILPWYLYEDTYIIKKSDIRKNIFSEKYLPPCTTYAYVKSANFFSSSRPFDVKRG